MLCGLRYKVLGVRDSWIIRFRQLGACPEHMEIGLHLAAVRTGIRCIREVGLPLSGAGPYAARKYGYEEVGNVVLIMFLQVVNMSIDR